METVNPGFTVGQLDSWTVGEPSGRQAVQPSDQDPVRLLEIERELAGPDAKAHLARYDAVLSGLATRLEKAMKDGLSPDEFPRVEAMQEANTIARKILRLAVRVDGQPR